MVYEDGKNSLFLFSFAYICVWVVPQGLYNLGIIWIFMKKVPYSTPCYSSFVAFFVYFSIKISCITCNTVSRILIKCIQL